MKCPNCRCNDVDFFDRSCANCANAEDDGTCFACAGDNDGHCTEISDNFVCNHWIKVE